MECSTDTMPGRGGIFVSVGLVSIQHHEEFAKCSLESQISWGTQCSGRFLVSVCRQVELMPAVGWQTLALIGQEQQGTIIITHIFELHLTLRLYIYLSPLLAISQNNWESANLLLTLMISDDKSGNQLLIDPQEEPELTQTPAHVEHSLHLPRHHLFKKSQYLSATFKKRNIRGSYPGYNLFVNLREVK